MEVVGQMFQEEIIDLSLIKSEGFMASFFFKSSDLYLDHGSDFYWILEVIISTSILAMYQLL